LLVLESNKHLQIYVIQNYNLKNRPFRDLASRALRVFSSKLLLKLMLKSDPKMFSTNLT
jgi:hypothetical protein